MTKPMVRIHDLANDEVIDREMTVAEFNSYKAEQTAAATAQDEAEAKVAARQAILDRLGLTAEEAALLLA